jgi:hypothetical protein
LSTPFSTFARDAGCHKRQTLCWIVAALQSARHPPQNGVIRLHSPGSQKYDSRRVLHRRLLWRWRTVQLAPLFADCCAVCTCHVGGLDSSPNLAETFEFVVFISLIPGHTTLNRSWHLKQRWKSVLIVETLWKYNLNFVKGTYPRNLQISLQV